MRNALKVEGLARSEILEAARAWIGTPYMHQASAPGQGCDCLGLIRGVWRMIYGAEPEQPPAYAPDWAEAGGRETLLAAARRYFVEIETPPGRPGDLVLFRWRANLPAKHAGILAPGDRLIHAHDGATVAEVPLGLWQRRIAHIFSFPGVID
ncbi:MAG: NlpC/P60 family protein [Proteobacteria bacterium]|nr:NlpC/P60 family protein [Pseudomonadota bacterium]